VFPKTSRKGENKTQQSRTSKDGHSPNKFQEAKFEKQRGNDPEEISTQKGMGNKRKKSRKRSFKENAGKESKMYLGGGGNGSREVRRKEWKKGGQRGGGKDLDKGCHSRRNRRHQIPEEREREGQLY